MALFLYRSRAFYCSKPNEKQAMLLVYFLKA